MASIVRAAAAFAAGALVLVSWSAVARADAAGDRAAAKALVKAQNGVLVTFRSAIAAATGSLAADVVALERKVALGTAGADPAASLFDSLVAFQTAVQADLKNASDGQAGAAKDILAGLTLATEGQYPFALYPGDGTPTAAFEASVDSLVAKTYASVRKRLARTVSRVEAAGTHVSLRLVPPPRRPRIWDSTHVDFVIVVPPTVDVVVASSSAAATGDGRIRIAGEATVLLGFSDDVVASAIFDFKSADQTVASTAGRYTTDFGGAQFVEGVYLIALSQGTVPGGSATIGLR